MTDVHLRRYQLVRSGRLVAMLLAPLAVLSLPTTSASAQDRPFWENDSSSDQRRPAPSARSSPRREDSYRPPDDFTAPSGGFGRQAGPDGQSFDPRNDPRSSGGYGSPGGYGTPGGYGSPGGYPQTPAYDQRPPAYGAPAPSVPGYSDQRQADAWRDNAPRGNDAYRPPGSAPGYQPEYQPGYQGGYQGGEPPQGSRPYAQDNGGYGQAYGPPPENGAPVYGQEGRTGNDDQRRWEDRRGGGTYSQNEVVNTGHQFFGSVSQGLANAVEQLFKRQGRPNGYILGEDAGGAFVAGLRYGEGVLYTKDVGNHRVYWQGPSLGYDFGGEGSKTMVLVYNLRDPSEMYTRFGGVQGAAYLIGGVSVQFQTHEHVTLAVIRSGVGLRLGANVGYLKYTRTPTWNPF